MCLAESTEVSNVSVTGAGGGGGGDWFLPSLSPSSGRSPNVHAVLLSSSAKLHRNMSTLVGSYMVSLSGLMEVPIKDISRIPQRHLESTGPKGLLLIYVYTFHDYSHQLIC